MSKFYVTIPGFWIPAIHAGMTEYSTEKVRDAYPTWLCRCRCRFNSFSGRLGPKTAFFESQDRSGRANGIAPVSRITTLIILREP
ncbi:hypothetical protein TI04_06020 [Achromatium sp. WMS2]|nr:hypothetical protein TI04_06020 [Achromatium sp. WMS2]